MRLVNCGCHPWLEGKALCVVWKPAYRRVLPATEGYGGILASSEFRNLQGWLRLTPARSRTLHLQASVQSTAVPTAPRAVPQGDNETVSIFNDPLPWWHAMLVLNPCMSCGEAHLHAHS